MHAMKLQYRFEYHGLQCLPPLPDKNSCVAVQVDCLQVFLKLFINHVMDQDSSKDLEEARSFVAYRCLKLVSTSNLVIHPRSY